MPDFGLTKALARGVRAGAKKAKVVRPAEEAVVRPPTTGLEPAAAPVAPVVQPAPVSTVRGQVPAVNVPAPELPPSNFKPVEEATALRLSQARLRDFALDEPFQTNFDTITTTDDIKAVIADVAQTNAGKIQQARRGVITNEQLRGLADDLDVEEDVVRKVLERESGGVLNPETILAARQVLNSSADRLKRLANKVVTGKANDLERLQFRRQVQFHGEYQTQFMGARAEAGRALNAFGIPVGVPEGQLGRIRELVDNMYRGDTDKLARVINEAGSTAGISKLARKYNTSRVAGVLNELFINAILSGPRTHIVNLSGNVLMQAMNAAETAFAARLGRFLGTKERVEIGEASALLHGTLGAVRDGFRLAGRAVRTGQTLDNVAKYEHPTAISSRNLLPVAWQGTPLGRVVDGMGTIIRAPTERVMAPTDEFFKTLAYRAELERRAFLHTLDQVNSGASKVGDAPRIARDFMEDAPLSAKEAAEDYARLVTFQNPLGEVGRKFQNAIRAVPALGLIAPFIRTPINIFKAGLLDRTPIGLFSEKIRADIAKGGRARDMALARLTLGSLTAAYVAAEVTQGNISGGGPRNPDARQVLEASGWRAYSMRVRNPFTNEDEWHSYARMEPFASVIGATADTVEILSYITDDVETLKDEQQRVTDAAAAIVAGITNNTLSKTFMKGMSDFSETLTDPARYIQNWGGEMATAILPFSALRRQITQTQDPYLREAWTILDKIQTGSGIPGWSEDAPPRRDIFGDPRRHKQGSVLGSMSPIPQSTETSDPLTSELVDLMTLTRQVPVTMPGKTIDGMRLETDEYDDLVLISRTQPIFARKRTFKEELDRTMRSSAYLRATPDGQVEMLKNVQRRADDIARDLLAKQNLSFADRLATYQAKKSRLRFGEQ